MMAQLKGMFFRIYFPALMIGLGVICSVLGLLHFVRANDIHLVVRDDERYDTMKGEDTYAEQ